jgi:hypothetical protein
MRSRSARHRLARELSTRTMTGACPLETKGLTIGSLIMAPWRRRFVGPGGFAVTIRTGRGGCFGFFLGGRR